MWNFFRRKAAPPQAGSLLSGAPRRPRLKTYSSQSGYVYQYVYRGNRPAEQAATEYVFSATPDRKNWELVRVILDQAIINGWSSSHDGRTLQPVERYAIAKLALFDFFDESRREAPKPLRPTAEDITRYLDSLGRL